MYVLGTLTTTNWAMGAIGGVRLDPQTGRLPKVPGLTSGNVGPADGIRIHTNLTRAVSSRPLSGAAAEPRGRLGGGPGNAHAVRLPLSGRAVLHADQP